jgi:PucR C-terminal helix-turn-helix domain
MDADMPHDEPFVPKGLKGNAMGLVTSTAIGLASTAPAYSIAATLGFVVVVVGVQTPLLVVLAFIPMFFSSWANKEMNAADPDCGTSFTWAARALGPKTGWFAGGWGEVASDFLSMASYAQIRTSGSPTWVCGLIHVLRDDPRVQGFVELRLGVLLNARAAERDRLFATLEAYVGAQGNKKAAAESAHVSRSDFYQRRARLEELLDIDLTDAEEMTSLHVALLAFDELHPPAGGTETR